MRIGIVGLWLILLSGCSIFSPVKTGPTNTYVLNTIPDVTRHRTPHRTSLLITEPVTSSIYNTTQMAYTEHPYQVSYFVKNRWVEPPTQMLETLMLQTLQNSHYFHTVSMTPSIGHYEYVLNTQLLELKQDFYPHVSVVRIKLRAQLLNTASNRVVMTREFSAVETAPEATPYGGVVAANLASSKVLRQLANFLSNTPR